MIELLAGTDIQALVFSFLFLLRTFRTDNCDVSWLGWVAYCF